jgi:hypothetical protein
VPIAWTQPGSGVVSSTYQVVGGEIGKQNQAMLVGVTSLELGARGIEQTGRKLATDRRTNLEVPALQRRVVVEREAVPRGRLRIEAGELIARTDGQCGGLRRAPGRRCRHVERTALG